MHNCAVNIYEYEQGYEHEYALFYPKSDWQKRENPTFFASQAVGYKNGGVSIFQPVMLQRNIYRPFHWLRWLLVVRRSWIHFLECRSPFDQDRWKPRIGAALITQKSIVWRSAFHGPIGGGKKSKEFGSTKTLEKHWMDLLCLQNSSVFPFPAYDRSVVT